MTARWTVAVPLLALIPLALTWGTDPAPAVVVIVGLFLTGAVLAAVHHAEVVAHRVGEPFGSLVLAVAVTVIEVALIVTLMVSGGGETSTLARDTVFAAAMITCNGIVGISLLLGALRRGVASFNAEGAGTALATVAALATLCLVLPTFTTSRPGPEFSTAQLTFAAIASLVLYGSFVFVQTSGTATTFCPSARTATRSMPLRLRPGRRCSAWRCCSSLSSMWSDSRRPSRSRSRTRSRAPGSRTRPSAS
jgi:Ca2+:H+ antiporter